MQNINNEFGQFNRTVDQSGTKESQGRKKKNAVRLEVAAEVYFIATNVIYQAFVVLLVSQAKQKPIKLKLPMTRHGV